MQVTLYFTLLTLINKKLELILPIPHPPFQEILFSIFSDALKVPLRLPAEALAYTQLSAVETYLNEQ
jgi:hypothetical protein